MRRTLAALAAAGLLLAGCSNDGTSEQPAPNTSRAGDVAGLTPIPTPSDSEEQALLDGLEQIDPLLVDDHAAQNARNVCGALRDGSDPSINERFEVNLSEEGEQKVVNLIQDTFCPW